MAKAPSAFGQEPPTVRATMDRSGGSQLLVMTEGGSRVIPLPDSGEVVIGRSERADVRVDDPSISRLHASLHIGDTLRIEDLGSANGTQVGSARLGSGEACDLPLDAVFEIGTVVCAVRRPANARASRSKRRGRPRRLYAHDYFEMRLEDECRLAQTDGRAFAVVRLRFDGVDAPSTLASLLRPQDVLAEYGPGEYELIVPELDDDPQTRVDRLIDRLDQLGHRPPIGVALCPDDGTTPEGLMEHACEQALGLPAPGSSGTSVVVTDPVMLQIHRMARRVAAGMINVVLLGETGVGKDVLAALVHHASPRADGPFVKLNCAAMTESLFESELFGHEKGAFTGATSAKVGLLEAATGGTVFLDEVGELPLSLQAKLLRAIEERKVLPVGSIVPRPIDVRFVAATNRDLEAEVAEGTFRADLFYRLNGLALVVPPLRERVSEIEGLAQTFIDRACEKAGRPQVPELSRSALRMLERYAWPGNIRELRNALERAVLLSTGATIEPRHLPLGKLGATFLASPETSAPPLQLESESARPDDDDEERARILDALERCAGNQSKAARLLGISRRTMVNRLDQFGLPRPRKPVGRG